MIWIHFKCQHYLFKWGREKKSNISGKIKQREYKSDIFICEENLIFEEFR